MRFFCDSNRCRDFKPIKKVEKFNVGPEHKGTCPDCGCYLLVASSRLALRSSHRATSPKVKERNDFTPNTNWGT